MKKEDMKNNQSCDNKGEEIVESVETSKSRIRYGKTSSNPLY